MNTRHPYRLYRLIRSSAALILALALLWPGTIVHADTSVCGPITNNTTWTSAGNNYIVTCNVIVNSGVTLTIQSGVVVKFDPGTSLQVNGTLVATGSIFTSNNLLPAKGDWGHIYFTATSLDAVFDANGNYLSGSKIQDSLIEWGGNGTNVVAAIEANIASPFLYKNTIQNNLNSGIHGLGRSTGVPVVIQQNTISTNDGNSVNGAGIYVSSGLVISNTINSNGGGGYTKQGGGIYATASILRGNTVTANFTDLTTVGEGGGIYATGSTITANVVSGNTGSGIYASGSTISANIIDGNTANSCAGIDAKGNSTITNNYVSNNTATNPSGFAGGICSDGGLVNGNTISGNSSPSTGGGIYAYNTTVRDNQVSANNALHGSGVYAWNSLLTGNTLANNHASGNGGGIFAHDNTTVTANVIHDNTAAKGGGIYAEGVWGNPILNGNTVQANTASSGAGMYAIEATSNGNTIIGNAATGDGGGMYVQGGAHTGNKISANSVPNFGHGSGVYLNGVTDFSYNDVLTNTAPSGTAGGISINGLSEFHYNNLYGNLPYNAEVVSSQPITGTLNYWGLLVCTSIPERIYDRNDAPGRGKLTYAPSLYLLAPVAQLAAPSDLALIPDASGVTLTWTPLPPLPNIGCRVPGVSESDLKYLVYYDTDSACAPFNGSGLPSGPSPIEAGSSSQIILPGASSEGFVFTVTAFDYLGRESTYSNLVGSLPQTREIYMPLIVR